MVITCYVLLPESISQWLAYAPFTLGAECVSLPTSRALRCQSGSLISSLSLPAPQSRTVINFLSNVELMAQPTLPPILIHKEFDEGQISPSSASLHSPRGRKFLSSAARHILLALWEPEGPWSSVLTRSPIQEAMLPFAVLWLEIPWKFHHLKTPSAFTEFHSVGRTPILSCLENTLHPTEWPWE